MNKERQAKIDKIRRSQPINELERKWKKAKGRHSNQFWAVEWLDLAIRRAEDTYQWLINNHTDQ